MTVKATISSIIDRTLCTDNVIGDVTRSINLRRALRKGSSLVVLVEREGDPVTGRAATRNF